MSIKSKLIALFLAVSFIPAILIVLLIGGISKAFLLIIIIMLLVVGVIAVILAKSFADPIHKLAQATADVAKGKFDIKIDVETQDEVGKLAQSFNTMAASLSVLDQAKAEFVSIASHQLRTPISIIGGYVELLQENKSHNLDQEQIESLEAIHRAQGRMAKLIQALLDTSRIEMGVFAVELSPVNIAEIADGLLGELTPQFESKKLKLTKELDKNIPNINADPNLVRIIIQNLCTNAIRYTPEKGQIHVAVSRQDQDILIRVKDTGIGIPKDAQPKVFSKLFRADNAVDMVTEGTGLGLYIIKSLIDYSGGKVWFESKEVEGTTFYVKIPLTGMKEKSGTRRLSVE